MRKHLSSFYRLFTLKHLAVLLSLLIVICVAILIGYFIGFNQAQEETRSKREQTQLLMEQIKEIAKIETESSTLDSSKANEQNRQILHLKKELKELLEHKSVSANHEYAPKDKKATPPPSEPRVSRPVAQGNARLVIIMDDVSYAHDVKAIRSIGLPLVMSFLPPSSRHPETQQR